VEENATRVEEVIRDLTRKGKFLEKEVDSEK
jgi:hypothetical protein